MNKNKLYEALVKQFPKLSLEDAFEVQRYVTSHYAAKAQDKNVARMRRASGSVNGNLLETFLYMLMRDHLQVGVIEGIVLGLSNEHDYGTAKDDPFEMTNGWLALYAKDVARRLQKDIKTGNRRKD